MFRVMHGLAACLCFSAALTSVAIADELGAASEAATQKILSRSPAGGLLCFPAIQGPADVHIVHGAGTDRSQATVNLIRVEKTESPVLLVLHENDPVIWRLDLAEGVNIAGVQLVGYYEQMIEGLPAGVPVGRKISKYSRKKETPYCAETPAAADRLAPLVEVETRLTETIKRETQRRAEANRRFIALITSNAEPGSSGPAPEEAAYEQEVVEDATRKLAEAQAGLRSVTDALRKFYQKPENYRPQLWLNEILPQIEFTEELAKRGAFEVVSYQTIGGHWTADLKWEVTDVVISDEAADRYAARKAEGRRILENLEVPNIPILPKDSPREGDGTVLRPSNGPRAVALIQDLIAKGYLREASVARDYACEKRRGAFLAQGFTPPRTDQCVGTWSERYSEKHLTILGPIIFPDGLCGGYSADFFLPPGVPEPTGHRCHSNLIRLEAKACLDDGSDCWRN